MGLYGSADSNQGSNNDGSRSSRVIAHQSFKKKKECQEGGGDAVAVINHSAGERAPELGPMRPEITKAVLMQAHLQELAKARRTEQYTNRRGTPEAAERDRVDEVALYKNL